MSADDVQPRFIRLSIPDGELEELVEQINRKLLEDLAEVLDAEAES